MNVHGHADKTSSINIICIHIPVQDEEIIEAVIMVRKMPRPIAIIFEERDPDLKDLDNFLKFS